MFFIDLHTWWMFVGTFDGGDGVSFGDSPILCGDSPRIKFRATESEPNRIYMNETKQTQ